jgi:hypothetical protein
MAPPAEPPQVRRERRVGQVSGNTPDGGTGAIVITSPETFSRAPTDEDAHKLLKQAKQFAIAGYARRFAITVVGPDRPGLIAA